MDWAEEESGGQRHSPVSKTLFQIRKIIESNTVNTVQKTDRCINIRQLLTFTFSLCATSSRRGPSKQVRSLALMIQEIVFQILFALTVLLYSYRRLLTFRRNSLPLYAGSSSNLADCLLSIYFHIAEDCTVFTAARSSNPTWLYYFHSRYSERQGARMLQSVLWLRYGPT